MKQLFTNIPLHIKLLLIGVIPLAFSFFLALKDNRQKEERLELLEDFRDNLVLNSKVGELSGALLTERRISFARRMNNGYSEAKLLQQQSVVDGIIAEIDKQEQGRLGDYKRYSMLNQLPAFRQSVLRDSLSEIQILGFYTPMIQRLITLMINNSERPSFIEGISEKILADNLLLQMSNSVAILRSDIYYALEKKEIPQSFFDNIRAEWMGYRAMETELFEKADSFTLKEYRKIIAGDNSIFVTKVLEEINTTGNILLAADAEEWWRRSIEVVENIKSLKAMVVSNLLETMRQNYVEEKNEKNVNLALLMTVIVLVMTIIYFSIRSISSTLTELSDAATRLSLGELGLTISKPTPDVLGKLTRAVTTIDTNKQKMAAAAVDIGNGKFDTPLSIRSDKDVIGHAMQGMRTNLIKLSKEQEEKMWMQSSVRSVADAIMGDQDVESIAHHVLRVLSKLIGFEVATFYVAKSPSQLHYVSGYALEAEHAVPKMLNPGQSLAGQAFLEKKMLLVETPEDFYRVNSGAGKALPRQALIFPVINNHQVEGVMELGAVSSFEPRSIHLLEEISEKIAVALQAAKSRTRLQELLEETQAQAEELQVQHSEMENLNSELEAHTQKLQASEEELRVQQEELQQANAELEERTRLLEEKNQEIAERTLEIQAKAEQLEASTRYKSEFLANMSHELRTPLNSILLLSRLMADNNEKNLTEEQVEYSRVIQSSGQGLLLLIDEILDLSKIEAGKMSLEYEGVLLTGLLSELRAMFEPMAKEKNLEFKLEVAPGVPELIQTDKLRLEQVIRNLVSNSLKFTREGSITVEVEPAANGRLSISVADTGIGIPPEKKELIFDAFQQADGSTRRKFGGTGLGLSISRELVKLMGGTISVESQPGIGSRFTITVPVIRTMEDEPENAEESTAEVNPFPEREENKEFISEKIPESIPDDRKTIRKNDKSILIIEDDVNFAKSLIEYTRQRGYKALSAVRGDEGIELARRYKPSGVLLDIQLPVKSGWQVMEELKNDSQTRHIPVHIMSSHQVRNESLLKGAINFIHKPVAYEQMNDIFKRIEHIVSKESQKVLILEENPRHAKALAYFLESSKIATDIKHNIEEGIEALKSSVDCVVLDMGIPNQQAYDMLENIKKEAGMENTPVIIFTGKSLSAKEQERISKYADSIVVKTAQSYQRILSEVSLFLHIVETGEEKQKKPSAAKLGGMNEVLSGKKVLVVDDDVRNIFSLSKALEKFKVTVVTATDGREGLEKLAEHKDVDIVLLDMMMPEMDGYETARKIRENKDYKNLPVIAVTAKAMTGDREKCIKAGASDYITKPVDTDQLLSLLRVWLYEKS